MTDTLPSGIPIRLRAVEPADTDALYIWENTPGMWQYGCSPAPYSRQQLWEYARDYDADPLRAGQLRLIIEAGGERAGAVDLYDIDVANRRAMAGIMVADVYRRRGVALKALELIAGYAARSLALARLAAMVAEDNTPSARLFAKAGYSRAATIPGWVRRGTRYVGASLFIKNLEE